MTQIKQEEQEHHKLNYGTSVIDYSIVRSRRRKTSEIMVDAKNVMIRTPYNKPLKEIKEIVRAKAKWISVKQSEYNSVTPEIVKPSFQEGSTLPYLGTNYPFRVVSVQKEDNSGKERIELQNGELLIFSKNSKLSIRQVKFLYEEWILEKARSIFEKKIKVCCMELGIELPQINIKNLKNRWGSTTKHYTINLNMNLLKAPQSVIDYLILHELCHLRIKEHSHHFWSLLRKFMPDYQDRIKWLRINGSKLV